MEKEHTWPYGHEISKFTMSSYFESVGLKNIKEESFGAQHSLQFWGKDQKDVKEFFNSLSVGELDQLNQGYLLFTYGEKK